MTKPEFIARYKPKCFYHFTDIRNIESIIKHGLLSLRELQRTGVTPIAPGGNQWSRDADIRNGVDDYVHLCLFDQHPMEYRAKQENRITNTIFLEIKPEIILHEEIGFTNSVANKSGVTVTPIDKISSDFDFACIYDRLDWKNKEVKDRRMIAKKYELLIPKRVDPKYINFSLDFS